MVIILLIVTISETDIEYKFYQFEEGYVELWYQLPVREISLPFDDHDSIHNTYRYSLMICSDEQGDSVIREGVKGIRKESFPEGKYVIDFFPLYLYPGNFTYKFTVFLLGKKLTKVGKFEVIGDTVSLYASDLILGLKSSVDTLFKRQGVKYKPSIDGKYFNRDTLFSYLEIYGLIPDSLFYHAHYQVVDSLNQILYENQSRQLKYNYTQFDTHSINLSNWEEGDYKIIVEIYEPALNLSVKRECNFSIKVIYPEVTDDPLAWEIKYLISDKKYETFLKMNHSQQIQYLKKFWSKRDFNGFKKRISEADERFSTSFSKGRDTPMGRFYIINGAPDEVYYEDMRRVSKYDIYLGGSTIGKPRIVWVYETKGMKIVFEDTNGDGVYELIGISKLGTDTQESIKDRDELKGFLYRDD